MKSSILTVNRTLSKQIETLKKHSIKIWCYTKKYSLSCNLVAEISHAKSISKDNVGKSSKTLFILQNSSTTKGVMKAKIYKAKQHRKRIINNKYYDHEINKKWNDRWLSYLTNIIVTWCHIAGREIVNEMHHGSIFPDLYIL